MKSLKKYLGVLTLSLIFQGCFSKAPVQRYYMLDYVPTNLTMEKGVKPLPYILRIKDFDVAEAYRRPEIVYRKSAHELRFYNFHQWAVKPEHLISDMVFKHVQKSQLFKNTIRSIADAKPDYSLSGQILALEEYDNQEKWYAHLAMTLQLEDSGTRTQIWTKTFDVRKVVEQHEPVYVVRELSFLLEHSLNKAMDEIHKLLTADSRKNTVREIREEEEVND